MHFCNVISRPNQNSKKILRRISRVVGHPCAMKIRTFCAEVLNLPTVGSPQRAAHGGQPTAHGGPFRIGSPYPVGSDKLIRPILSHRHIPYLTFIKNPFLKVPPLFVGPPPSQIHSAVLIAKISSGAPTYSREAYIQMWPPWGTPSTMYFN